MSPSAYGQEHFVYTSPVAFSTPAPASQRFDEVFPLDLYTFYPLAAYVRSNILLSRLVIGTSRTVGSAKKFVRITSGFWWRRVTIFVMFFVGRLIL
jgi:hypothetical protein